MKTVLGCVRKADTDFGMIEPGDKIAVGISGGKDSLLLLYALSLFTKYMSSWDDVYGLGTSYRCEVEDESSGLHITMIQRGDGEYSIAVINPTTDDKSYQINLEESLGGATLYRYRYSAGEADVSLNFEVPKADIAFTNVEKTIVDTVPGGTVAIYSTIKDINE